MRKSESKIVRVAGESGPEDCEITITALDGNTGAELGFRLLQSFGPGILGLMTAKEANDSGKVSEQASALLTKLSPTEFSALRRQLLKGAQAKHLGEFLDVDERFVAEKFSGHLGSLLSLIVFALKLNFSGFFDDLGISKDRMSKLMGPRSNP